MPRSIVRWLSLLVLVTVLGGMLPPAIVAASPAAPKAESPSAAALPLNAMPSVPRPAGVGSTSSAPAKSPATAPNLLPPPPSLEIIFDHGSEGLDLSVKKPSGAILGYGGATSDSDGGAYTTNTTYNPLRTITKVSWPAKKAPLGKYVATLVDLEVEGRTSANYSFSVYINGQLARTVQGQIDQRPPLSPSSA